MRPVESFHYAKRTIRLYWHHGQSRVQASVISLINSIVYSIVKVRWGVEKGIWNRRRRGLRNLVVRVWRRMRNIHFHVRGERKIQPVIATVGVIITHGFHGLSRFWVEAEILLGLRHSLNHWGTYKLIIILSTFPCIVLVLLVLLSLLALSSESSPFSLYVWNWVFCLLAAEVLIGPSLILIQNKSQLLQLNLC